MSTPTISEPRYSSTAHMGFPRFSERCVAHVSERVMQASWCELMSEALGPQSTPMLDLILGEASTERDAQVAGTIMQWLASSQGSKWLENVQAEFIGK